MVIHSAGGFADAACDVNVHDEGKVDELLKGLAIRYGAVHTRE